MLKQLINVSRDKSFHKMSRGIMRGVPSLRYLTFREVIFILISITIMLLGGYL